MRAAFLTHQFPHARMGGIGAYTVAAASALAAAGVDAHIFTFDLPADVRGRLAELAPGVTIHEAADPAARVAVGSLSSELAAAIQSGGEAGYRLALGALLTAAAMEVHGRLPLDIIEAPEYEALGVPVALRLAGVSAARRPALVTHLHSGSAINRRGNGMPANAADRAIDALELAAIELADGLCAPSHAVVRETRVGLPFEREVDVIPQVARAAEAFAPPPEHGPIVFIGRLERLKGAEVLIEAAGAFLQRCGTARMLIIGPDTPTAPAGSGATSMRRWMSGKLDAAWRARVDFTGELPPSELARHLAAARFVVVPSLYESFSLVAADAMAAGRTVVVSSGIGATEVVGDAGMTFERGNAAALAEAMERLWRDRALGLDLSRRAYARAKALFDPSVVVPQRVAFYERTIKAAEDAGGGAVFERRLDRLPAPFGGALLRVAAAMTGRLCGAGDEAALTPGVRLLQIMERLNPRGGSGVRVLLYGAGRHSTRLLTERHIWEKHGHGVAGFIDDAPRWSAGAEGGDRGAMHLNLPVQTCAQIRARAEAGETIPPIVLSTDTFEDQFWEQTAALRAAGVMVLRLYGTSD